MLKAGKKVLFLFVFMLFASCSKIDKAGTLNDIALYNGPGTWSESAQALKSMLMWMGYGVSYVNEKNINANEIGFYKLFCIPDGNYETIASSFDNAGRESIKQFLKEGGALIAIGASSHYASDLAVIDDSQTENIPLSLFDGTSSSPVTGLYNAGESVMAELSISDRTHPILDGISTKIWIHYSNGPSFQEYGNSNNYDLATFVFNGLPAMEAFQYGHGRVFICGGNPEFEENHDRDSVTVGSSLNDPESDWPLMKNAVRWCLE